MNNLVYNQSAEIFALQGYINNIDNIEVSIDELHFENIKCLSNGYVIKD